MENAATPPAMPPTRLLTFELCTLGEGVAVFDVVEVCDTWWLVRVTSSADVAAIDEAALDEAALDVADVCEKEILVTLRLRTIVLVWATAKPEKRNKASGGAESNIWCLAALQAAA